MNKIHKVLSILTIFILCLTSNSQDKKNKYFDRIKTLGIKTQTIYTIEFDDNGAGDSLLSSYTEYNKRGRLVHSKYFQKGNLSLENTYIYSRKNILTTDTLKFYENDIIRSISINEYDKKGKLSRSTSTNSIGFIDYQYDYEYLDNKMISISVVNDDTVKFYTEYIRDKKGNILNQISIDPSGKVYSEIVRTYDSNGFLTEEKWEGNNDLFNSKTTYVINNEGQCIESVFYDGYGKMKFRNLYTFDENTNITFSIARGDDNSILSKSYYFYEYY